MTARATSSHKTHQNNLLKPRKRVAREGVHTRYGLSFCVFDAVQYPSVFEHNLMIINTLKITYRRQRRQRIVCVGCEHPNEHRAFLAVRSKSNSNLPMLTSRTSGHVKENIKNLVRICVSPHHT